MYADLLNESHKIITVYLDYDGVNLRFPICTYMGVLMLKIQEKKLFKRFSALGKKHIKDHSCLIYTVLVKPTLKY